MRSVATLSRIGGMEFSRGDKYDLGLGSADQLVATDCDTENRRAIWIRTWYWTAGLSAACSLSLESRYPSAGRLDSHLPSVGVRWVFLSLRRRSLSLACSICWELDCSWRLFLRGYLLDCFGSTSLDSPFWQQLSALRSKKHYRCPRLCWRCCFSSLLC